jgi:hypothetical protein
MVTDTKKTSGNRTSKAGQIVLGSSRFAKISAVEGIVRTPAMKKRAKDFDERGLTGDQRRAEIRKAYRK